MSLQARDKSVNVSIDSSDLLPPVTHHQYFQSIRLIPQAVRPDGVRLTESGGTDRREGKDGGEKGARGGEDGKRWQKIKGEVERKKLGKGGKMKDIKAREEGDKQGMIGCQTADKKHKVNVKLRDHKERTCPLLCLLLSLPLSPTSEP